MKTLRLLPLLLLLSTPAFAQTSLCDNPPLTGTINVTAQTFDWTVCIPNGMNPTGIQIKSTVGTTTTTKDVIIPAPAGPANATKTPYHVTITLGAKGNYSIVTNYANGSGRSPDSVPFVLAFVDPLPTVAPTNQPF
jgi:hypothetical protein